MERFFSGWPTGLRPVGVAGISLLFLVGCSAGKAGTEKHSEKQAPVLLESAELRLPMQEYLFSSAEQEQLDRGRSALVDRCLRRLGQKEGFALPGAPTGAPDVMDRRYGVTDAAGARAHGYHLRDDPSSRPAGTRPRQPDAQLAGLLHGEAGRDGHAKIPEGGCIGEADRALAGPKGAIGPTESARQLNFRGFTGSRNHPRVTQALDAWSACMKRKKYEYPDPLAAMSDPRFRGKTATPLEREVAAADVSCKKETDLIGVWFAAETAVQKELIARNPEDFDTARKAKQSQLTQAAAASRKS